MLTQALTNLNLLSNSIVNELFKSLTCFEKIDVFGQGEKC